MEKSLSRREMIKHTAAAVAAGVALPTWGAAAENNSKRIVYLPSLFERARKAIHCLTEHCDVARGYLPYFYTRMADQPPCMALAIWSYGDGLGRSVDALALLRHMRGESLDQPPDRVMRASLIGLMGQDGLSWCPAEPWTMPAPHTRPAWLQQGTLLGLTTLFQLTGEPEYRLLAERNIRGLLGLAQRQPQGVLSFPGDTYTLAEGWSAPSTDPMHRFSAFSTGTTMPANAIQ